MMDDALYCDVEAAYHADLGGDEVTESVEPLDVALKIRRLLRILRFFL